MLYLTYSSTSSPVWRVWSVRRQKTKKKKRSIWHFRAKRTLISSQFVVFFSIYILVLVPGTSDYMLSNAAAPAPPLFAVVAMLIDIPW